MANKPSSAHRDADASRSLPRRRAFMALAGTTAGATTYDTTLQG